ncbi:hypothetical protein D9M68_993520 [compost metagenome]
MQKVVAQPARKRIVLVLTEERVVAGSSDQGVVAIVAVDDVVIGGRKGGEVVVAARTGPDVERFVADIAEIIGHTNVQRIGRVGRHRVPGAADHASRRNREVRAASGQERISP